MQVPVSHLNPGQVNYLWDQIYGKVDQMLLSKLNTEKIEITKSLASIIIRCFDQ